MWVIILLKDKQNIPEVTPKLNKMLWLWFVFRMLIKKKDLWDFSINYAVYITKEIVFKMCFGKTVSGKG